MSNDRFRALRRIGRGALACGIIALATTAAFGGLKTSSNVSIYNTVTGNPPVAFTYAEGSMGSARASADSVQYIGCSATAHASNTSSGRCFAKDVNGTTLSCNTTVADQIRVIESVNGQSYVQFTVTQQGGSGSQCQLIYVENSSNLRPTAP